MRVSKAKRLEIEIEVAVELERYFDMLAQGGDFGRKPCKENFFLQCWERQEDSAADLPREAAQYKAA